MRVAYLFALLLTLAEARAAFTDLDWHDTARHRNVPVRIYLPAGPGPFPVIIFSHGLGGSKEHYTYLGDYWSAHGYASIHVQHLGSDSAIWKNGNALANIRQSLADPDNLIDRPRDISFAIDQIIALNRSDPTWKGKFDPAKIGVAGHSFGAYTTMAIAGEKFPSEKMAGLADPRVKAVVAMSTPSPNRGANFQGAYGSVHLPALHMTGTEDETMLKDDVRDRRNPFDFSPGPDTYLVIFEGGDHMVFSGRKRTIPGTGKNDIRFQALICEATTAFWDAYLKGDAKAKDWLANGAFQKKLGAAGTFEKK